MTYKKHWMSKKDMRKLRKLPKREQLGILRIEKLAMRECKEHPQLTRKSALLIASQHIKRRKRK